MLAHEKRFTIKQILVCVFALLVPSLFYLLIVKTNSNIPLLDDYDSNLAFLNHYSQLPTAGQKISYILTSQHNEYKLIFEHSVVATEFFLLGHENFALLNVIGSLFVILLAVVLWKTFLPQMQDTYRRFILFLPVILLLFELQYQENFNWTTTALQNIPVVPFCLFSLYFLLRKNKISDFYALLMYALAVFTSGNGFFIFPVGLLILLIEKRWKFAGAWVATTVLLATVYFWHYNFNASQGAPGHSLFSQLLHFNPVFFLSFLGSILENAHRRPIRGASLFLGIGILLWLAYAARRGYYRKNPFLGASSLFVLLTGGIVSSLRSDFGIAQSLASRYHIYCVLLLIFCYTFLADEFLQSSPNKLAAKQVYGAILVASIVFCFASDFIGYHSLLKRRNNLIHGMNLYLHPNPNATIKGPVTFDDPEELSKPDRQEFMARAHSVLIESTELGIYRPTDSK